MSSSSDVATTRKKTRKIEQGFYGAWTPLVECFGSVKKLAEALQVSEQNVYRWSRYEGNPSAAARANITRLAKECGVKNPLD